MNEKCIVDGCSNFADDLTDYCVAHFNIGDEERLRESEEERPEVDESKLASQEEDIADTQRTQENPAQASSVNPVQSAANTAENVKEKVNAAKQAGMQARATVERIAWGFKGFIAMIANPVFWITAAILVIAFVVINSSVTSYQTFGRIDNATASAGMSDEMLKRLAQRAVFLKMNHSSYGSAQPFVDAYGGGSTNNNPWDVACPDIVNIIYGMPDHYIGNNGDENAWRNYQRAVAAGLQPTAWWFPSTASPGATKENPPAGAIASYGGGAYGHTWVMLTDEIIIDNTGIINGSPSGAEYRKLNDFDRSNMTGWFVPPDEGYEGTFLDDAPGLPPAPEWAGAGA